MTTTTNITEAQKRFFNDLTSGQYDSFALFSCFFEGKPATAIINVEKQEDGGALIRPMALLLDDDLCNRLTDHEGKEPMK